MKKIENLKEIQNIQADILEYTVSICKQNNLKYFLAGGTLLGAIRHHGFIPWDNDIDISMPRNDYEKLCDILKNAYEVRYSMIKLSDDNDYCCPFIKIIDTHTLLKELAYGKEIMSLGIGIDIFPIDGIKNKKAFSVKKFVELRKIAYRIARCKWIPNNISAKKRLVKRICYFIIANTFGREKTLKVIDHILKKYPYGSTEYIVSTYGLRAEKEIIEYSAFAQTINVEFEGKMYNAPVGYDKYLTQMYGDYMKLPPESERVAPHDIVVYLKEDSEE